MRAQMFAHRLSQRARSESVNDAHGLLAFEESAVEELVGFFQRIVDALADEVEFGGLRRNIGGAPRAPPRRRFRARAARPYVVDWTQILQVHGHPLTRNIENGL